MRISVLNILEATGVVLLDGYEKLERADDKRLTAVLLALAGVPGPRAEIVPSTDPIPRAAWSAATFVVKFPYGGHGNLVRRTTAADAAATAQELWREGIRFSLLAQPYLPEGRSTVRVVVMDGRIVWAAIETAAPTDWRSNGPAGGSSMRARLDDHDREGAVALEAIAALGLTYGSVDMVLTESGPTVLEVNSSAGVADAAMAEALISGLRRPNPP
jgi:glutathione synthase/RimK-type ligase-like ATP-grasp enzyme